MREPVSQGQTGRARLSPGPCEVCGRPLPPPSPKGGRPAQVHRACRRLADALSYVETALSRRDFLVSYPAYRAIRSRLWYSANCLNDRLTPEGRATLAAARTVARMARRRTA